MPETLRSLLGLIFPAAICLIALVGAALFFGADIPASRLLFSAVVTALAGLAMLVRPSFMPGPGVWASGLLCSLFAGLTLHHGHMDTAGPYFAALVAGGGAWFIARSAARSGQAGPLLWRATLGAGALIAMWAFFDFMLAPASIWGVERPYGHNRLSAGFLSANTAATFMGLITLMGLAECLQQIRRLRGDWRDLQARAPALSLAAISTMFAASCLVLTASRGGIAFTATAGLTLIAWQVYAVSREGGSRRRSLGLAVSGGAIFLVLAGLIWTVSGELASTRFERFAEDPARELMFEAYWNAIPLAPLFGHGLGSFPFTNDLIATSRNAATLSKQGAAHNVYLEWLLQAGWAGSIAMWLVLAGMLGAVWQGLKRRRRDRVYLRATLCISLLVMLHGLTDYALEVPGLMWWWAWILGLGAGIAAAGRSGERESRSQQSSRTLRWPIAARLGLGTLALTLSFAMVWQGEMRVLANSVPEMPSGRVLAMARQEALPPSAYLREALAERLISPDLAALDLAERASLGALEREPRLVTAWNRLVFIDLARQGQLGQAGHRALEQSFYLRPYGDREAMRWRLEITALTWHQMDEALRRQSLSQVLALSDRGADRRWMLALAERSPEEMRLQIEALLAL